MADRTTDGALSPSVDPVGRADVWESVLSSGIAETGIDPTSAFSADDPADTTPQPSQSGLSADPATPHVTAGDDGAGSTAAASTGTEPARPSTPGAASTPSPAADPSTDPLAGASPFTFDVNGQARTIEGAFRIPGEGLYVPEDKVSHFQQTFARAEAATTFEQAHTALQAKASEWERLSAWQRQTRDAQGNAVTETLTGQAGLEAQRLVLAEFAAKTIAYEQLFADPVKLAGLLTVTQDEQGQVTGFQIDPAALENFQTRVQLDTMRATQNAQKHFSKLSEPPPPAPPSASDHAEPTIQQLIQQHAIAGLTDADRQFLRGQFPRYVMTDRSGRPTALDPEFLNIIKDRASMRAEALRAATAAEAAGKFNGRMTGGRTAPKAPVRPQPVVPAAAPAKVGKAQQWDDVLQSALQEITL